jgi:hypothetical protein
MSATLDSENVFKARMSSVGLDPALAADLITAGLNTMSKLAFICGIQPGVSDDKPFVTAIYDILARDPQANPIPALQISFLRRLWFESHTTVMSEVKHRLEQTEETLPKKLPLVEREARRKTQVAKLAGVDLTGHLEPAHSLIDFVWSLRESETLKYVDPCKCGSRESEIKGSKKETFLKTDSSGRLFSSSRDVVTSADTSNEYRLRIALQRRSLALDQVDIIPYSSSERYHDELYALTMRQVPPSHFPITTSQILEADKTVWARCAQLCRDGLSPSAGKYPFEDALMLARTDPVVISILQPLPKPFQQAAWQRQSPYGDDNRRTQFSPDKGKGKDGKGKKGGRGRGPKGSGKGKEQRDNWLPSGLKGKPRTRDGSKICYSFNLGSCQTTGSKCERGAHVCTACNEGHAYINCPKKN